MASISTIQRQHGESYMVSFNRPDGRKSTRTFRDRAEAEAFANQHGGWGRGVTGPRRRPLAERLWERVAKGEPGECWPWIGSLNRTGGYGSICTGGHASPTVYVHRVAYELTHGPIPEGLVVRHKCDNPPCCNPAHLEVGTHQDNARDMWDRERHPAAHRTHCAKGHEYTSENTRYSAGPRGLTRRTCRSCERAAYYRKTTYLQRQSQREAS